MKFRKVAAVLLAAAMTASMMSGCGKSAEIGASSAKESSDAAEQTNDEAKAEEEATAGAEELDAVKTSSAGEDVKEFTAFFAVPGDELNDDNEIQQKIAEITGAKVKETWLTGQTAEEAVGTLIAGGEYPDFIDGSDGTAQLYAAGALVALDDYLDNYPNLKNFWSEEEWDKVRQDDGHIYWIPQFGNPYEEDMTATPAEAFWIQTRVLKWDNYPEIKTLDQYFDLIERYNEANPVMEDGTSNIPYTILCDDWRYFCLENPPQFLDGYPNDGSVIVNVEDKKIVDYNTTPTAKAYFQKLNEEFQKGIVDPESFTQSYDEYIAKLSSGRVLGMVDQAWQFQNAMDTLKQQGLESQGCSYVPLALTISEDLTPQYMSEPAINVANGVGITVSCEDVEGALQFLNDILEPEVRILRSWGIEGVDYEVGDDGIFYRTDEEWAKSTNSAYKASHGCAYSYLPNYTGLLADKINTSDPKEQPSEFIKSLPSDTQECLKAYGCETYVDMMGGIAPVPGPWFPMYSYSNTMTTATAGGTAWTKMGEIKHEYLPKVVMAEDFEQGWSEYLDVYAGCQPEDFLSEMQEELDRRIENAAKYQ
ncbi:sugar ABC transporter substrate-binding protein [Murimonas intestini]|uniref:Aldouronate transport system substrate-binding protein n=1 Tax=Murimonas intestini TaxID=1337051 RepID=A0AB73T707_9FIRM|nr:sugar ABC transporter substrate-binding protein [Murimonas intestini]MCR1841316.1 sugar ABC transporter substrate-binding protein [Murimonas intestini]MCR1866234.1 sugar ABC transporter substrate-binding protein [Murimonas intestini]MCR1882649.1 sugar ABC transporter substrate-binding protein [Murimonas intestini]